MTDNNVDTFETLVKYNNPVLVIKHPETKGAGDQITVDLQKPNATDLFQSKDTTEILNSILPPRYWEEDGQLWTQSISSVPTTRQDVINLQELLHIRLQQTQARETGICPVRRELFSQCFDETIRQVTINCAERGLLLLRIRDELNLSMEAYETLYCSSVAFGMRKALHAQEEKEKLREKVQQLEADRDHLDEVINNIKKKNEQYQRRYADLIAAEEKKVGEEIAFLKKTNAQLKAQLQEITALKK